MFHLKSLFIKVLTSNQSSLQHLRGKNRAMSISHLVKSQNLIDKERVITRFRRSRKKIELKPLESLLSKTYGTAENYNYDCLLEEFKQDPCFSSITLPNDIIDVALFQVKSPTFMDNNQPAYFFVFRFGVLSFWNLSTNGITGIKKIVQKYEVQPNQTHLIANECEEIDYKLSTATSFNKTFFEVNETCKDKLAMGMFVFANSLAISVKLSHFENNLEKLIKKLEPLPQELISSRFSKRTTKALLVRTGEIFLLRHQLNLQNTLINVPDAICDDEVLSNVYLEVSEFLHIVKRVNLMNEQLSYCTEIVELVKSHLYATKTYNVEVLIVLLILIEVLFEIVHFVQR